MRRTAGADARGFALVATLWVLAALAVLAAYIDGVARDGVARAELGRAALQAELDRRSTEATLIYLLATNRRNYRGVVIDAEQRFPADAEAAAAAPGDAELGLAGQTYSGLGAIRFALQDEAGLVSVNTPRGRGLAAALESVGISAADAARIVARAEDYVDLDGNAALNGAERFDYTRRNLQPPPNWLMATPMELHRVLDVPKLISADQWHRLRPLLTMRQAVGFNLNTMPPPVLAAVLDLGEHAIGRLLAARAEHSIFSAQRFFAATGRSLPLDPESLLTLPGERVRITTWRPGSARRAVGIHFTPYMDNAPWRKDYQYTVPALGPASDPAGGTEDDAAEAPIGTLLAPRSGENTLSQ